MTDQKVIRPGDVVRIYGKPRLVVAVAVHTLTTGNGRGYRKYWTKDQVSEIIVRNFKLKPDRTFDGVIG